MLESYLKTGSFLFIIFSKKQKNLGSYTTFILHNLSYFKQEQNAMFHLNSLLMKKRKSREEKKFKNIICFKPKSKLPTVNLWKGITVKEIAIQMKREIGDILKAISYMENKFTINDVNSEIHDTGTIIGIAKYLGHRVTFMKKSDVEENNENEFKDLFRRPFLNPKNLIKRRPIVTIMGHVDHGKTTLLDALRNSSIVSQEHGGITQHIGAFTVNTFEGDITFLDTPGHAAFRSMRARGANITDIVVLVVAADDGIMEQTLESIKFSKEANVPIIVALNKIDKPQSNLNKIKQDLLSAGIQVEELGGDVQCVPISALKKINLEQLIEAIHMQAEIMELKADPTGTIEGIILESSQDTLKGKVATILLQHGTLKKGDVLVAGTSWIKVHNFYNENGQNLTEAFPGMPVQIYGWKNPTNAGDLVLQATSEKIAHEVVEYRKKKIMKEKMKNDQLIIQKKLEMHLEKYQTERNLRLLKGRFRKESNYFREKECVEKTGPNLAFVLKGDVHGSIEAIMDIVKTYKYHDVCQLEVIHTNVGDVTENDIKLAEAFNGIIYSFNVKIPKNIQHMAIEKDILIKPFKVIYHLIDDMKMEISKRLPWVQEEDILGEATVLQQFIINEKKKKIPVAGCRCIKGVLKRNNLCKVIRKEKVLYNGPIISLRHEKSDVETVKKDVECGLMVEDSQVLFEPGDSIICYLSRDIPQQTAWNPGF